MEFSSIPASTKQIHFYKYQGSGNDFILLDNRNQEYSALSYQQIALLCDRRFGIGADGFMLLEKHENYPFCMSFFNSDGMPGSMCGNGGRCICAFAKDLGIVGDTMFKFWSSDGEHEGTILSKLGNQYLVRIKMRDVILYAKQEGNEIYLIDSGSPHYISFVEDCDSIDVVKEGKKIRFSKDFPHGVNVNFVEQQASGLKVRTYERGVEDETFSCGTGVTASSMAFALKENFGTGHHTVNLSTKGGNLQVDFLLNQAPASVLKSLPADENPVPRHFKIQHNMVFSQVHLEGLATFVFEGDIQIGF